MSRQICPSPVILGSTHLHAYALHLLKPTNTAAGRDVLWSHPAFANRHIYARNDQEIIAADLTAP